ncbi:hypothetical protein [Ornithinibacillus sp. JPR2-1]|uniref:hypothetical protein n=1 Tax=Ornithinibacillus sp. JPR2-1 TaxID=2094019 RepID=UPI0031D0F89B
MKKHSHDQIIKELNELLNEDVTNAFEEQLKDAGEHGIPSFIISNQEGKEIEVAVEWDKEADQLYYKILKD